MTSPTKIELLAYVLCFLGSLLISGILTWKIRNMAVRHGWLTGPTSARHVHRTPMPRFGGVAIYLTFVVAFAALAVAHNFFPGIRFNALPIALILPPATLLMLVGLYDDFFGLNAKVKFGAQIVAGILLYGAGFQVSGFNHFGIVDSHWASILDLGTTVLWVLWISNAFNLIDGLDGLAAGSALFSMITLFAVSIVNGNLDVAILTIVLAGCILGFLKFNFNPATIFLGDCGSLFLGFTLSALALAGIQSKSATLLAVAIPIVSFGLPLMETVISVIRRFLSGKPLFSPDREHIHHKLLDLGFTHRQVVVVLYAVSAFCAILSLFLLHPSAAIIGVVLLMLGTMVFIGVQQLGYNEFFELRRVARRTIEQKGIIANNVAIRRAANKLREIADFSEIVAILKEALADNEFDAFRLVLRLEREEHSLTAQLEHSNANNGWQKSSRTNSWDHTGWSLRLNLLSSSHDYIGYIRFYRYSRTANLLLDTNILISELQPALSKASELVLQASRQEAKIAGFLGLEHNLHFLRDSEQMEPTQGMD